MLSYKKSGSITVREYETAQGQSPFGRWFANLDAIAAAKSDNKNVVLMRVKSGGQSRFVAVPLAKG